MLGKPWAWRGQLAVVASLAVACGDEGASPPPSPTPEPPAACVPGQLSLEAGGCLDAGLPPDLPPCPPGESVDPEGGCRAAGIEQCGTGFEPDGARGCTAVLAARCDAGMMAVPGDARCREVAPCPASPWGDAPVDGATQFVDGSYAGADADGSAAKPWNTIQEAVDAATPGAVVAIASGSYVESVHIDSKPVRIWGRCPGAVEIDSPSGPAIDVSPGVVGVEVHDVGITGSSSGVEIGASASALLDRVHVHDTGDRGVGASSKASVTIRGSLFERAKLAAVHLSGAHAAVEGTELRGSLPLGTIGGRGLYAEATSTVRPIVTVEQSTLRDMLEAAISVIGSDLRLEASLVRGTQPGSALSGVGIYATDDLGEPSNLEIDGSSIEANTYQGVATRGSTAAIRSTVIRDTEMADGEGGYGIGADEGLAPSQVTVESSLLDGQHGPSMVALASELTVASTVVRGRGAADPKVPAVGILVDGLAKTDPDARLTVRGSVVERTRDVGIAVFAATADIEGTVVRDTYPGPSGGGAGVVVSEHLHSGGPSSATIAASVIERSLEQAIAVYGSDARIVGTVVRNTTPGPGDVGGWGVVVSGRSRRATATIRSCVVERSQRIGVAVTSADATIEATLVRDTLAAAEGSGVGVYAASFEELGTPAAVTIAGSVVERSVTTGIHVADSSLVMSGSIVRDTSAHPGDGSFGDGVVIFAPSLPTSAEVTGSQVSGNARVGIVTHGGALRLGTTRLDCNAIDLARSGIGAPTFDDLGDNVCGCAADVVACAVEAANLSPPTLPQEPPP